VIVTSMKKGGVVSFYGLGRFYVGRRAARSGRNPRTGATILIPRRAAGRLGLGVLPGVAAGALDDLCH